MSEWLRDNFCPALTTQVVFGNEPEGIIFAFCDNLERPRATLSQIRDVREALGLEVLPEWYLDVMS